MSTKRRILETASALFNRDGWQAVSVRDIAGGAGISPGNLTYHFPRKEDVARAILAELRQAEKTIYLSFPSGDRTCRGFLDVIRRVLRMQLDNHGILSARYLIHDDLRRAEGQGKDLTADEERRGLFANMLDILVREGELNAAGEDVTFLVSFMQLFSRSWILDQSLDGTDDIERYLYLLAQQLYYFATEKGMASIDLFLDGL